MCYSTVLYYIDCIQTHTQCTQLGGTHFREQYYKSDNYKVQTSLTLHNTMDYEFHYSQQQKPVCALKMALSWTNFKIWK